MMWFASQYAPDTAHLHRIRAFLLKKQAFSPYFPATHQLPLGADLWYYFGLYIPDQHPAAGVAVIT